jgi:hypothetical protein
MRDQSPLIVPIVVEAFVVNDPVRRTGSFYRADMQYNNLADPGNGGLGATDLHFVDQTNPQWSGYYNGVYLKWRLPDAFTQGVAAGGATPRFPCVPNRWLVVRSAPFSPEAAPTAWIVQSDYLTTTAPQEQNASERGSVYVQPTSATDDTPIGIYLGRNVPLAQGTWKEEGSSLKLTALAPGNPAFACYQPTCNNVFSLIDPLDGQVPEQFRYQVFGWFSEAADDPLAQADSQSEFACVLEKLGWYVAEGTDAALTATWSLLCGMVTGVEWQSENVPAGGAPGLSSPVSVAVGNTTVEALTAMVTGQGRVAVDADLLEAFQLGLIDLLDKPDPGALLADAVHSSRFQKFTGGYVWEIVDAPGTNSPADAQELHKERQWLATLNQNQAQLDLAQQELTAMQRQLYVLWWKYVNWDNAYQGSTSIPHLSQAALAQQLDPTEDGSLASQVVQQQNSVKSLAAPSRVPTGETPTALQEAIQRFAEAQGLSAKRVLKRASAPNFYEANNPVVLIAGAGASGIVPRQPTLRCRFPSQVVRGFRCGSTQITAATPKLTIPLPVLTSVSGVAWLETDLPAALGQEGFLLDPNNAAVIATATGLKTADVEAAMQQSISYDGMGILPTLTASDASWTTNPWRWQQNPWHPLLLLYQASYYPIDYGTTAKPNWTFADGRYTWNGEGAPPSGSYVGINGILQLTPAAAFNMQARIKAFLNNNPDLAPKTEKEFQDLLQFVLTKDNWDLLSQALDGFNQQLLLNQPGTWLGPGLAAPKTSPALKDLLGPVNSNPPQIGSIPESAPYTSSFLPWRCGQFVFTDLQVVDEWGQAVYPIDANNYRTERVYFAPEMTPLPKAIPSPDSVMQLSPALLQPGRLDFDLVSADNDNDPVGLSSTADPICGWVLPNHLDASLMAYDAQGKALGEMSVALAAGSPAAEVAASDQAVALATNDQPAVCWVDAPGSPYRGLKEIEANIKHFGPFLWNLKQQGPDTFALFLKTIDETLWTTLPLDAAFDADLAALIGCPLAMVRARLQFETDGPPVLDPGWQYTLPWSSPPPPPPPPASVVNYRFAIELGNSAQLEDGLIGYFCGENYTRFNVTHDAAGAANPYLKPIGVQDNYVYLSFDAQRAEYVSMLVDPRAVVHARTGILPTRTLAMPPHGTTTALAAMNITFRVEGLLTDSSTTASPEAVTTILLPVPHEKRGVWKWVENDAGEWREAAVAPNNTTARLSNVLPVLRRGLLQLSAAVDAPTDAQRLAAGLRIEKER